MMGIAFVLILVSFRSLVAPLRAVVCTAWMIVMTCGMAIFLFQLGGGGMSWIVISVCLPLLIGLGLDYDIFYTESIMEKWEHGLPGRKAVVEALDSTANTISAAGIIMAVAFTPLMLSPTPVLKQMGFILVLGVLIDCFVNTKVMIPSVVSLLRGCTFWPRKLSW